MKLNINQLQFIKIDKLNNSYSVSLIDNKEYEIIKGYGNTVVDAFNDLHHNLI
ncbi:hypothetical protein QLS71_016420 [Mariniflexile litorale]|uniref:Uncharacterized protein n=1 Tax=Mariniflexile litorale TaxID=3045158 RepID=A0AAU7EEX1_9FLAO|nr:hypothetical protein [Mariniflexile sp. KMM 9835]MDQ8212269.1 hypothetical protein [Mariniflexile sp. KMM 9835]